MIERSRRSLLLASLLLLAIRSPTGAQTLTPNTILAVPPRGHVLTEAELSWYRADAFVSRAGIRQRFPGDLDFLLGVLRLSYAPIRHLALGVDVPYRWAGYHDPGVDASFNSRGLPGIGAFLDWFPIDGENRIQAVLRAEFFRASHQADRVINVSDEVDRSAATVQIASGSGRDSAAWRWDGTFHFEYGARTETQETLLEGGVQLHIGPRIATAFGRPIYALGLMGFRRATSAIQEGNFFHERTSTGPFAGLLLAWAPYPYPEQATRSWTLSAVRDVSPRNSLSGWRVSLSVKSGL